MSSSENAEAKYRYTGSMYAAMHAALFGWLAKRRGEPITACPYDVQGDAYQAAMARYWVRGWSRTTPE